MESELAKTLRAMSDDHRMVPDFSEQLLDIADAIERQAKELADAEDGHKALEGEIRHRGKRFDLLRLERDALQENVDRLMQERDAAIAEVERLKVDIKGEALKMVEDMYPSEYIR